MCQIFDISPRSESFGPLNFILYIKIVREVLVIQLSIVSQEEAGEVEGQVRVFIVTRNYQLVNCHFSQDNSVGPESGVNLRIVFQVFEENRQGLDTSRGLLIISYH